MAVQPGAKQRVLTVSLRNDRLRRGRVANSLFAPTGEAAVITFLVLFLLLRNRTRAGIIEIAGPDAERRRRTSRIIDDIEGQIQQFLIVFLLTGAIVAVATWSALVWLGVDHAAGWGILAGVFYSIPYFGPVIDGWTCSWWGWYRGAIWPRRCLCRAPTRDHVARGVAAHALADHLPGLSRVGRLMAS
jgi:hypothetical protein